ncbi:unnamed protein product [Pleuronectes platessa]|uniref:Uncharacterized protein n=1 Tax=Pleuronectes platessa TaxID=8262 RepID=A0A9N7UFV4_PLEPL|nr:unnamed protein product [Pleuronectes platessa]
MASDQRPLADLLRDVANQLENSPGTSSMLTASTPSRNVTPRHPVEAEVSRLFAPYSHGERSSTRRRPLGVPTLSSFTRTFCCLEDKSGNIVPSRFTKEKLASAGLGEKRLTFQGSQTNPNDFREFILTAYPKLRQGGGFELLRIAGTTRSRNLNLIPCPNEGYNVKYLKDTQIGHAVLFIRPLQRSLDLEAACQPESMVGPPAKCISCGEEFSFSEIKDHSDECMRPPQSSGEGEVGTERASSSRSQDTFVRTLRRREESEPARASSSTCTMPPQGDVPAPELIDLDPFGERSISDWKIATNAKEAARAYKEAILSQHASRKALSLIMDLGDSAEDRERAILSFYKMAHVEWACPLTCTLIGDPAIGDGVTRHFFSTIMHKLQNGFEINFVPGGALLFEGEKDHLLPSTSLVLLESDLQCLA